MAWERRFWEEDFAPSGPAGGVLHNHEAGGPVLKVFLRSDLSLWCPSPGSGRREVLPSVQRGGDLADLRRGMDAGKRGPGHQIAAHRQPAD